MMYNLFTVKSNDGQVLKEVHFQDDEPNSSVVDFAKHMNMIEKSAKTTTQGSIKKGFVRVLVKGKVMVYIYD